MRHPSDQDPCWEESPLPKIEKDECVLKWFFFFFLVENQASLTPPPLSGKFHNFFFEPFPKPSLLFFIFGQKTPKISILSFRFFNRNKKITLVLQKYFFLLFSWRDSVVLKKFALQKGHQKCWKNRGGKILVLKSISKKLNFCLLF